RSLKYESALQYSIEIDMRVILPRRHVISRHENGVHRMEEIVTPQSVPPVSSTVDCLQNLWVVDVGFGDEMNLAAAVSSHGGDRIADFGHDMRIPFVGHAMDGINPQTVKVKLVDPIGGVCDDEGANNL